MIYLSWLAFYEGATDRAYFDVLIPRLLEEIALQSGTQDIIVPPMPVLRPGREPRSVDEIAKAACSAADAAHLLFIHADTGGRALEAELALRAHQYCDAVFEMCQWPRDRCIMINPRHEMEGWLLADSHAVAQAFGYRGNPGQLGLPGTARAAERLADPKQVFDDAFKRSRTRRRGGNNLALLPAIAQSQSLPRLQQMASFRQFEMRLRRALQSLGCI